MKKKLGLFGILCFTICMSFGPEAFAETWDSSADFSLASNPNGAWTYARKMTVSGTNLDVCGYVYHSRFWLLGPGIWSPSFQSGLLVWADKNANGYPALRWTSPQAGSYNIAGNFTVADDRGGDNLVYVVVNGVIHFYEIHGYEDSAPYTFMNLVLQAGDMVDFIIKWDDRVAYKDYGWIRLNAKIETQSKPPVIKSFKAVPQSGPPPLDVEFICSAKDPDGTVTEYRWEFGDGEDAATATGSISHSYKSTGTFDTKVTVVDNDGGETTSKIKQIKVYNGPDLTGKIELFTFDEVNHNVKIKLRVSNTGDWAATPFSIWYHLSNDGTTPLSPAFKVMRATRGVAAGASIAHTVAVKFNDSIYGKYILVYVDSEKEVTEIDEGNNGTRLVIQPMATQ